jgi:hypothetical protein
MEDSMSEQIFYHFLSSRNAIHDLERGMIRVSPLDTLNDPFELSPWLRYRDINLRKRFHNVRRAISKKDGLLCFSKSWSEPLLWAHYADKHKGIALGFEISKYEILEVKYIPGRVKLELTGDREKDEKIFRDTLASVKYEKWDYENEYRIWVRLEDCTKIDGHHFIEFGDSLKVKEIVLGCKYDNSEKYILKLSENLGAKVIPSRMAWGEYKINPDGYKIKIFQKIQTSLNLT